MNRREFLKKSALCLLGLALGEGTAHAEIYEPMIYKRFFGFTEYEERPGTDFLVIHHTGFPVDKDSTAAAIHKFHQEDRGWAGIGYHYLIRKDGMIEQGRLPDMIGAHSYECNRRSLGISLAGNFNLVNPTDAQIESVKELCRYLCEVYNLDGAKPGVILGHRDLNDTSCPGDNLYSRLPEIREAAVLL